MVLEGKVVWVTGGGDGVGRALAIALSARGAGVLVTGTDERALGETVGEIVHGGGRARHLAGDARDSHHAREAAEKALVALGGLDVVLSCASVPDAATRGDHAVTEMFSVYYTFLAALARMSGPGRLVRIARAPSAAILERVLDEARPRPITCNAIAVAPFADADEVARRVLEIVLRLIGPEGDPITGQVIPVVFHA